MRSYFRFSIEKIRHWPNKDLAKVVVPLFSFKIPIPQLGAANICKSEEVILKVVLADTKSEQATLSKIKELSAIEDCISILPPLPFYVHSIVVNYKDFKDRPSVVFALHLVGDKDKNIIGYAIGAGRPGAI